MAKIFVIAAENSDDEKYSNFLENLQSTARSALEVWDLEKVYSKRKQLKGGKTFSEKLKSQLQSATAIVFVTSSELKNFLDGKSASMTAHKDYITKDERDVILSFCRKEAGKRRIILSFGSVMMPNVLSDGDKNYQNFLDADMHRLIADLNP